MECVRRETDNTLLGYAILGTVAVLLIGIAIQLSGGAVALAMGLCPERAKVGRRRTPLGADGAESLPEVPSSRVPRLNVIIMITGTHGDVAPFVALGHELARRYGHRIRVATHETHRSYVLAQGLEFYPLAGDPRMLSAWMVQSQGRLMPDLHASIADLRKELTKTVPEKVAMINAIMESTWPACVDQLPAGLAIKRSRFVAHAIISNPVTYGHFHCASALNVPLHIAFPQPWSPTGEYPHPFSGKSFSKPAGDGLDRSNRISYQIFDELTWLSLNANQWRERTLKLPPLLMADRGAHVLNDLRVPFAYMWSPSLSPKAIDWGSNVDVVGTLVHDTKGAASFEPDPALAAFLEGGDKPIFIGFGSMVIEDPGHLFRTIAEAVQRTRARVLVQSSWSKLGGEGTAPPEGVHLLGNCPHSWLLPRCSAAVHHGGAGTVAAGLRFGLPTFIVPFFGDQHFWGEVVRRAGVGPPPCPFAKLTTDRLVAAIECLHDGATRRCAEELARRMAVEDGVAGMCDAFTRHLPLADMVCMVSLFAATEPRVVVAEKWHPGPKLRVSAEVQAVLQSERKLRTSFYQDYGYVLWDAHAPSFKCHGLLSIPGNAIHWGGSLGMVLLGPFLGTWEVIKSWREHGGRTGWLGISVAALFAFCIAALETPLRFFVGMTRFFWNLVKAMLLLMFRTCCGAGSSLVSVRASHSGLRPEVDVATLSRERREDLLRAASVARHVLQTVCMIQGRRRGDPHRELTKDEVLQVLLVLERCPPLSGAGHATYARGVTRGLALARARSGGGCCRRCCRNRARVAQSDGISRAQGLLDEWRVDEAMSTVDFCLRYAESQGLRPAACTVEATE